MVNQPLRVAILGAGMIGDVHHRAALLAGAEVVGVMASSAERSREVASEWDIEQAYPGIDDVADSDVDVVHICSPNASHVPYAIALMQAGKHVICEKPLGLGREDAEQAAAVATETGVVNTMPFAYRFHPMAREMRARVQDESFGELNLIHGSYLQDWMLDPLVSNWRVDPKQGGPSRAFGDIGSHWCDLAEWVTGQRIATLVATTSIGIPQRPAGTAASFTAAASDAPMVDVETEDSALILFRTDGDVAGSAVISQLAAGRKNRLWLEVDGAEEAIAFDQEAPELLWCGRREGATLLPRDADALSPAAARYVTLPAGHPEGYADCFDAFVAEAYGAIRTGEAIEGLPVFADGLRAARITEAVLASARAQAWVEVDDAAGGGGAGDGDAIVEVGG
jgi:predicted dehydrogenase